MFKLPFQKFEEKSSIPTSISSCAKTNQVVDVRPEEKRLMVVEVWEKVVVPHGQTPVTPTMTPIISVECFKNDNDSEVRTDELKTNCLRKT